MNEEKDIKIGRVNRGVEKTLRLALANDVSVWMKEEDLNQLAAEKKDHYLQIIEGIQEIIKTPDFVAYDEEKDSLFYLKEFFQKGRFRKALVLLRHEGTPKAWVFAKLFCPQEEAIPELTKGNEFVRFTK